MEMENEETAAWQNYFLTRLGGKQLYLQMWEPVYRAEEISPDRYKGIDIPLKRFMDRKADGIIYTYDNSYAGLGLGFADCEAEWEAEGIRRGGPDLDAKVTIKEFRFPRFTRRVNHLVGLLDRWSLSQLIERDDAAVSKLLGKLTLSKEETEQYLEQAIACGAKNCTAALLEYKNAHKGAVDPMDAFVLD